MSVIAITALLIGAFFAGRSHAAAEIPATSSPKIVPELSVAEVRDLSRTKKVPGTLGYGSTSDLVSNRGGVVTDAATEGTTLKNGDVLFRVNQRPSAMLHGAIPAWRELGPDSTPGADITQLGQAMVALGHANPGDIPSADRWTEELTVAVKRWQASLGVEQSGRVELGDVVFHPNDARLNRWTVQLGATVAPGDPVATLVKPTRVCELTVPVANRSMAVVSSELPMRFADGTTATGTIEKVSVAIADGANAEGTGENLTVTATLPPGADEGQLDGASVSGTLTQLVREQVLAVPVSALSATDGKAYGVTVKRSSGKYESVAVETGVYSDTWVEITGGALVAGDEVVVTP